MKRLVTLSLVAVLGAGCVHNPPVISPTVAAALTNGLAALHGVLQAHRVSPAILSAITDAQTALADDVSGASWGTIVRDLLTNLYSQIPLSVQDNPAVWATLAALEVALAILGA